MPASKRSSESHSPQAKMMKLEGDDEATPGENNSSHKAEDAHERTVPPWTKKKDPPTAKEEDEEVASFLQESKPSPRQNDSDPPLKKAKLFIATSASSGTASPQSTESKSSQKRPASTELSRTASSDSDSETSLSTQTVVGDVSRCVTKPHNRAKRAATESLVDQSAASQMLDDCRPPYPTEMDHNYGRSSEGSSDSSVLDESVNTETEVNLSSGPGGETTQCINSTSLPLLQAMPYSVIQSTHPTAEARRHDGEGSVLPAEAGSSTEHVNRRPSAKHEEHKTEVSSERTSREPESQNHIDGKIVEPPAETSDPSSSDGSLNVTAEVNLSTSQSEERSGPLVELEVIPYPGAEPEAEESQDPAPEDLKPDITQKREAEERKQQDVTERTPVTEAEIKTGIDSPASNQNEQKHAMAGPSEGSLTPAKTLGQQEREDEVQVKTEKTPTAEPLLPDPTETRREETFANCCGVHQVAENLGSPPGIQAHLGEEIRVVPVAEESISAPESAAELQLVHGIQEPDDSTVSSSSEVVVTNSEEHVGRTAYECVTVQEPEITSNLDSITSSQGMCDVAPAEDTQPEVMQSIHPSTSTYSGISAQLTLANPDSRQMEYECVSECVTVQETPNLVSTTTDALPTEKTEQNRTQHLDVTPGTSSHGPELLPDTYSGVIADCVDGGEVQQQVTLSSSTAILGEKPNNVIRVAKMEEQVNLKVDDSAVPGLSSHSQDHMVVRPLNSEEQGNANVESTATSVISSTMPTEGVLHFEEASTDLSISTPVPSANENNEVVFERLAETCVNMDSTATDDQIPGHAQVLMEGVLHRETRSADNGSVAVDTRVSQHVRINAVSKEGETVISKYVHEQKTEMNLTTSEEISLTAPSDKLEDKEVQRFNDDYTSMSSEAPKHLTLSTSDCAPYMEMTEAKPQPFNQAWENENPEQEEQRMGTSKDGASQLIKYEMVTQSIPVQSPQIAVVSMTVPSQHTATPVPNKEMQTQKEVMAMDKHVLIANSQSNLNQGQSFEFHAVQGVQTDGTAESFTTSEVMDEEKENSTNLSHEVSTHPLIITSESAVNEDEITSECNAAPEAESYEDMHTTSTPEAMHEQEKKGNGGDKGNHSGIEHAPTRDKEKGADKYKMAADLHTATTDGVPNFITAAEPQIQVIHEEPIAVLNYVEEGYLISNAELMDRRKETTMEAVAYVTSGDKEEITSVEEKSHSVLENLQEGAGRVIAEVEVNASLSSTIGQGQAPVNSDVLVFVCGQQQGLVIESSTVNKPDGEDVTEQMETVIQSEGLPKDFQVVYEAISSPESTIDEEFSILPGSIRLPIALKNDTQVVEVDSAAISATSKVNVQIIPTQEADEQINEKTPACLPDSQSDMDNSETMMHEETAESSYVLPIEHTNGAVDMGDVLMVASSDEVPESSIQKTEAMADVLGETTSDNIPEPNVQITEAMADVLEETTSDNVPESSTQKTEAMADVLGETTSDNIPEPNVQITEAMADVLEETTSDNVPEPNIQKTEAMADVLGETISDNILEPNVQITEAMADVLEETTNDNVPEPNIQVIEAMADVLEESTSDNVPEPNIQKTEAMADVLGEPTSDNVPEPNVQKTEGMADVLEETTNDHINEQNILNREQRLEGLMMTTSNEVPKQDLQTIEEMREVPVVTTSDGVAEPRFQKFKEIGEVLVVATIDHIPEINIQNTEEMGEVPIVTTSDKVPEQNIQHTEEIVDVLLQTSSNHIPEQSFQKTVKMAEALVVAASEEIPECNIQKTERTGDVLVVATCENMPEQTMQQTEGMGDVSGVTTCDNMPEPTIEQMEGMRDQREEAIQEANGAPGSVEMQKDNRLQELSRMTQIDPAMALSQTPDSLSQEDVIEALTVPESADPTDIVTQAAAASGLTTSLSEPLNSDGQVVEADQVLNLNGTSQSFYSAIGVHQYQGMEQSTVTSSNEEAGEDMEVNSATNTVPVALLENYIPSVPNPDQQEEQSAEKNPDATEHDMEHSAVCQPQMPAYENASVDATKGVEASMDNAESDMQILVDIELGHQVEVQDESEMEDPDIVIIEKSQLAAEMPSVEVENGSEKNPINNADGTTSITDGTTSNADNSIQKAEETNKTSMPSVTPDPKVEGTVEKPKKQQMNTQARTKARLAALAEQKAAASKRAAQRQQLNLLALCEEIAEDIATDSMLLKRIEEEKIAAAAKMEAMKKESRSVEMQEATVVPPTPAGSQASSPPVDTTDKASAAKPTAATTTATTNPTAEPATAKPVAPEPPKRRFFVSQIVVPLKAHEKKKLTRYQRLRQVELQREKMSWTRVKKLKTDQAHQMLFSDIDFDTSNPFLMPPVATPSTPVANKPSAVDTSTASTSASTISALPAMPQVPDAAVAKPEQSKTPEQSKAVTTPDLPQVVVTPDPSKAVATPEPSKAVTTKTDQKVTATPARPGRPRREAATPKVDPAKVASSKVEPQKTEPSKATLAKGPTPKVTRSSTRKSLPAKPPPMPNGMNSQKAKSEVEYKPYRPRPKYSFEDFELDDDPPPVVQRRPMPQQRPGQQPGPSQQSTQVRPMSQSTNPTAQSRTPPSKPMFFSQTKLQSTPVRQVSSQSKPAISTPVMLKPATSTPVQSRPAISSTVQSKPLTTTAPQSKPVAFTTSQSKPTTSATGQLKPATSNASQSKPMTPTVQSRPVAYKAPQPKPLTASVTQSKPSISAAPQSKTTIAAATQPVSAVPPKPTLKNQVPDTVGSEPGKAIPSGPPAPQTPQPKADQAPKPQAGSLKEELEVKPALETPLLIPAVPLPDVSTETLSVQPPATPHNVKCKDSTDEVSPPPPSSLPPPEEQQTSSNMTESKEEKPEVKSPPPSPMKASPPDEQPEASKPAEKPPAQPSEHRVAKAESNTTPLSEAALQKEVKKLKDTDKDGSQTIIDAGQKHFGAVACSVCGMLYSASNPEDETQHILFHNQFISAVKYVGWKKERILGEYPDGKIILVLPDDPKYALKKVEEIREMVDNDLGFQQVETKCPSQTKTFLFISNDKKVAGCLIAEHIQEGYRVIEDPPPEGSEKEQVMFERQRAWCCSSTSEPAICGVSRIWVFSMMRRQGIASRMIECLRNNFIYGSCLAKDELAFSDPTPDGKLFATRYFGTSRFLVYNFVSGTRSSEPKAAAV